MEALTGAAITVFAGFLSGIISGMGIGGGAVLIPALTLFLGVSQKVAQGINIFYFIPTAAAALFLHVKNKRVELKRSVVIGLFGIVGVFFGFFMTAKLGEGFLRKIFGIFLAVIGVYEIFSKSKKSTNG